MTETNAQLRARAGAVRLLVLDVDGVLTDGRLYFTERGEEMKCFHVRDGAGIVQLQRAGVQVAIISGRSSPAVAVRARELGIRHVYQGIEHKLATLNALLAELNLTGDALACMGDDVPDLDLLHAARFAITVADAHPRAKASAHWITAAVGGQGAVREACDFILAAREASPA